MAAGKHDVFAAFLLVMLIGSITVELQAWVGHATIYSADLEGKREIMHRAILANEPPEGRNWSDAGAAALNYRVGVVFLAEGLRHIGGLPVGTIYLLLDTVFLFCALLGLFFFLRNWMTIPYCLIGVLYFAAILPLTYFLHFFHPWDRAQLAIWILLIYLLRERKILPLGACLAVSIVIKFDTILLPGLYFLVHLSRRHWQRVTVESLILFVIAWGTYFVVVHQFPAPMEPPRFAFDGALRQIQHNIEQLVSMNIRYPPLLVYAVPFLLIASGFRYWSGDRFISMSVAFAIGLLAIWFTFTVFAEIRSQLAALVLLLPAVLLSLQGLLSGTPNGHLANASERRPG